MRGLRDEQREAVRASPHEYVLNGIAYDASRDLLPRFREQVGAMASLVTQPAPSAHMSLSSKKMRRGFTIA